MEVIIVIGGKGAAVSGEHAKEIAQSARFQRWIATFKSGVRIQSISEEWAWVSKEKGLIFGLFYIQYTDETGNGRGEIVFFRSDAEAVLIEVEDTKTGRKYIILVEQIRIPAGGKMLEIPAGSLEENEDFLENAVREVQEEVGINVAVNQLIPLGVYYFSPGACNERIGLFYCKIRLSPDKIMSLKNRLAGLREHGENITVKLVPVEEFDRLDIRDAKTKLAYELYLKERG